MIEAPYAFALVAGVGLLFVIRAPLWTAAGG
jgi:hypothetical protein